MEDWQYFKSRWGDYVKATKLEGTDRIIQLLECCDDQLHKDLTRNASGSLTGMTEKQVLQAIKTLPIREENTMVARIALHNMRQDRDETVRAFGARLRGQASMCKFAQQCPACDANVDYTDAMVKDVLCRGLADGNLQMDLQGEKNQDMILEQVLKFVEAKEAGKRSASRLLLPQAMDAATGSSYRKQKKAQPKHVPPRDQDTCRYNGTKRHGQNAPTRVRRKECPAFSTKCNHCNKDHHYEVCRNKNGARPAAKGAKHEDTISDIPCEDTTPNVLCGDTVSDVLCEITLTNHTERTTLTHHVFNKVTKEWLRKCSKSQLFIRLRMDIRQKDYCHFRFSLRAPQTHTFASAMADTGCQSCLVGLKVVKKLGLSTRDLIPVDIKMHAANNNIRILGAIILRLSGKNKNGEEESTRQIVYITDNTYKLFLNREAWVDLGLIPGTFPTIGETEATLSANSVKAVHTPQSPPVCQCPKRTKPPPIPNSLPFRSQTLTGESSNNTSLTSMSPEHSTHVNTNLYH